MRHSRHALLSIGVAVFGLAATPARAQQTRLDVRIEYIAGSNLYLQVGEERGVRAGDTLFVYRDQVGPQVGTLLVLSATADRSVVVFAGEPFPVTRGSSLYIVVGAAAASGEAPAVGATPPQPRRASAAKTSPGTRASGRLSLDVAALQSTTRWLADEPVEMRRQFVTPTLSLRTAISDLPGGFRLDANVRAAYRYSTPLVVAPAPSIRVYQASVGKRFSRVPFQFQAGRFYNSFDPYGGYLDGVLARVGSHAIGVGAAVGFEPLRGNESFSSDLPKYTAFTNVAIGSGRLRYATELSYHELRPRDSLANRTYAGWSQRFTWRRVALRHDLQVDRIDSSSQWVITRLRVRGSLPLAGPLELSGRYASDRTFDPLLGDTLPLPRREQIGVGLSYVGRGAWVALDVTKNQGAAVEQSYTYSASLNFPRTPLAGFGVSATASYFVQPLFHSLQWSAGLNRSMGGLYARAAYLRYETQSTSRRFESQAVDVSLLAPLYGGVHLSLTGRTQWGDNLLTQSLNFGIWTSF